MQELIEKSARKQSKADLQRITVQPIGSLIQVNGENSCEAGMASLSQYGLVSGDPKTWMAQCT